MVPSGRAVSKFITSEIMLRMPNSISPDEIGTHLREIALQCIRMARECTDAHVARGLEDTSILLADLASSLETILTVSRERN